MSAKTILASHQLSVTRMRKYIVDIFLRCTVPLYATDVIERASEEDKTTIYRTLKTLERKNILEIIPDSRGQLRYAMKRKLIGDLANRYFTCEQCRQTKALRPLKIKSAELPKGYQVSNVIIVIKGLCKQCS